MKFNVNVMLNLCYMSSCKFDVKLGQLSVQRIILFI